MYLCVDDFSCGCLFLSNGERGRRQLKHLGLLTFKQKFQFDDQSIAELNRIMVGVFVGLLDPDERHIDVLFRLGHAVAVDILNRHIEGELCSLEETHCKLLFIGVEKAFCVSRNGARYQPFARASFTVLG